MRYDTVYRFSFSSAGRRKLRCVSDKAENKGRCRFQQPDMKMRSFFFVVGPKWLEVPFFSLFKDVLMSFGSFLSDRCVKTFKNKQLTFHRMLWNKKCHNILPAINAIKKCMQSTRLFLKQLEGG